MQFLVPAPRVSLHHQEQVLQGCRAAHCLSQLQTGDAAAQAPVPAPHTQPVPTTGAAITLESPSGRIQAGQRSGAALLIRAQWFSGHLLVFFSQFGDINKDSKSWDTVHFGPFEGHVVTSAAGTSSAVAQVGTHC